MLMVSCRDTLSADSPKIEGIEGNRPLRVGEIRRNPATIALAKFFYLRHRVLDRVSAGYRADDRVGPKGDRRRSVIAHFLKLFFHIFAPTVRIPLFKRSAHHRHRKVN